MIINIGRSLNIIDSLRVTKAMIDHFRLSTEEVANYEELTGDEQEVISKPTFDKLKEEEGSFLPSPDEVTELMGWVDYSIENISNYDELTSSEKKIYTEYDFNFLID